MKQSNRLAAVDVWRESFGDLNDGLGDDAWRGMSISVANAEAPDCGFGTCRREATVVVEHAEYGRRVVCEEHVGANDEELFGVDPLGEDVEIEPEYVSSNNYTQSSLQDYYQTVDA